MLNSVIIKEGDEMKKRPYITLIIFFFLDFISKQIIINTMKVNDCLDVIPNFFSINYVQNTGAAWSILKDQRILILIITVIVLFIINKYLNKENLTKGEEISFGIIMGGIIGNLFDRVVYHYVIDFLSFNFFGYHYPIFNLADTFIVCGIIALIIISYRKEHYGKNSGKRK